jgi:Uma2 family endonuclease
MSECSIVIDLRTRRPKEMAITKGLTLEQFLAMPEKKPALEYEDGRVTQKVSPQGKHSRLQFGTADRFNRFAEPRKLAVAFPELRTTFAGYSRVPDVAVYLWERVPLDTSGKVADEFFTPPDLVVEIRSPVQRINALVQRCQWYVENGVRAALLLDPSVESVRHLRPGEPVLVRHGAEAIELQDILPGFQLTPQELFDSLTLR